MTFNDQPTEVALSAWRFGQTQAERLVASILHGEGYAAVDPQAPLGGPDGLKDVLFDFSGWRYIAAAYFPTTAKSFAEVREKFEHDLAGVSANSAEGIAFFTNQRLTIGDRQKLHELAKAASAKAILYHVEALRAILDSPRGYGMRLEYLRIAMKPEEQLSFVSQFGLGIESAIRVQGELLKEIASHLRELRSRFELDYSPSSHHFAANPIVTVATRAIGRELVGPSNKRNLFARSSFLTRHLDAELLQYLHRTLMDSELAPELSGAFRSVGIWLGVLGATPDQARYVPPEPDKVPQLVADLLKRWREGYDRTLQADQATRLDSLVAFHHEFLRIHPFMDGNGRLARLLLEQQAREFLGFERHLMLDDSTAYGSALMLAHGGDLTELRRLISQALFGTWTPEA